VPSDIASTDVFEELLDVEEEEERVHRDDVQMLFGEDEDYGIFYDSADDELYIKDVLNDQYIIRTVARNRVELSSIMYMNAYLHMGGNDISAVRRINFRERDSAPPHSAGRMVLASPTWDPDGDGNGELVMSDGSAWNEVVDLPNYT